jgi:hypothetical protein
MGNMAEQRVTPETLPMPPIKAMHQAELIAPMARKSLQMKPKEAVEMKSAVFRGKVDVGVIESTTRIENR